MTGERPFLGFVQRVGWPDVRRGPWFIAGHWAEVDGRPEVVGLELWKGVEPNGVHAASSYRRVKGVPLEGVGASDLKALPVAAILARLWEHQRRQVEAQVDQAEERLAQGDLSESHRQMWELVREQEATTQFRGERSSRARRDDEAHFAEVAAIYRQAHQNRRPPTKAVAEEFTVSHSTATKWVARARGMGLLGPTKPGKAGGITRTTRRKRP